MKRMTNILAAMALWVVAASGLNSCIYDNDPYDMFYRTLWESDEVPLGPFPTDELTLEFLCGNAVSIKTGLSDNTNDGASAGTRSGTSYGTYSSNDQTAVFHDLTMEFDGMLITFIDAQRSGDTLFLRWRIEDSLYPFTTTMHRLSAYR